MQRASSTSSLVKGVLSSPLVSPQAPAKPILRLEFEEQFNQVPPEMRAELQRQLGVTDWGLELFNIRIISDDEKFLPHYIERIDAIHAGVEFLLDNEDSLNESYVSKVRILLAQLKDSYKEHLSKIPKEQQADIAIYQKILSNYVNQVLTTIAGQLTHLSQDQVKKRLRRAEEFALAKKPRPIVCTVTRIYTADKRCIALSASVDKPRNPYNDWLREEFKKIRSNAKDLPQWFMELSDFEKKYLQSFLSGIDLDKDLGTVVNSLSSKLRIIPAPANYGEHVLCSYLRDTFVIHVPEIRFSHIASRDILAKETKWNSKQDLRDLHAIRNLGKIINDIKAEYRGYIAELVQISQRHNVTVTIPILFQTLVSPVIKPDSGLDDDKQHAIQVINSELEKESKLYKDAHGIDVKFVIISTNHPLNSAKFIDPTTSTNPTGVNINALLQCEVKEESRDRQRFRELVKDKLEKYTALSLANYGEYRELYIASMSQLYVAGIGGKSIGGCVSGKDRKAIELMHTDALKLFYREYGRLPELVPSTEEQQKDTENFAAIFASIYCSKHQHFIAKLNAPGSFGIKTPAAYLPAHLVAAIQSFYDNHPNKEYVALGKRDFFKETDKLASNNDIKTLKSDNDSVPEAVRYPGRTAPPMLVLNKSSMEQLMRDAIAGVQQYLSNRPQTLSYLSGMNWESRKAKANCLQGLLQTNDLNYLQKLTILFAITSMTSENLHLQKYLSISMGFGSEANIAANAIHAQIREMIDKKLPDAQGASSSALDYVNKTVVPEIIKIFQNMDASASVDNVLPNLKYVFASLPAPLHAKDVDELVVSASTTLTHHGISQEDK